MASPIALFITRSSTNVHGRTYDYSHNDNVLVEGNGFVYTGQKQGLENFKLINGVENHAEFHVYVRENKSKSFMYAGSTRNTVIVSEPGETLKILLCDRDMFPQHITQYYDLTFKENALRDFVFRTTGQIKNTFKGINKMVGFYVIDELMDPHTRARPSVDIDLAYNWDIHAPPISYYSFSAPERMVYC